MKHLVMAALAFILIANANARENSTVTHFDIAISKDKAQIAYQVSGSGKTSLIFIHGWSLDSRLWRNQIDYFSNDYNVIMIDLAGHGNSSYNRKNYTMTAFANDIKAVITKENIESAILIGHSMGGGVIAEAAKLMPHKVTGIIGIDTSQNIALKLSEEELNSMAKPFEENFQKGMKEFVKGLFPINVEKETLYWITEDMASAPKDIAINQFRHYLAQYITGESYQVYQEISVPVILINAKLWPTNSVENKKHIKYYSDYFIEQTGHFPMLERPSTFNQLLLNAINTIK